MALTLNDLIAPQVIMDTVSRIRAGQGRLGKWFGWHYTAFDKDRGGLTGPNTRETPVRSGTYRILDTTRQIAQARYPGTGPAVSAPQPIGDQPYTCARFHDSIKLDAERLAFMSKVTTVNSVIDVNGQEYVKQQMTVLAKKFNNVIEFLAAGLIRGKCYLRQSGDSLFPCINDPGGNRIVVDFNSFAGNFGQLNMLGGGNLIPLTWLSPAAKIISHDLPAIMDAYSKNTGIQPMDVWCDPFTWGSIITNTEVVNAAGSANTPFIEYDWANKESGTDAGMTAQLRGYPQVTWHITSEVLIDNGGTDTTYAAGTGTLVPVIPPNTISILPNFKDNDWQSLLQFAEPIGEGPMMPWVKRSGLFMWSELTTLPSVLQIIGLINPVVELKIPKALVLGTVIF